MKAPDNSLLVQPVGRKLKGVRAISESTIEIDFRYRGVRCRERIKRKPTSANVKAAARYREAILDAIERGTFDYAYTFPDSPRASMEHKNDRESFALTWPAVLACPGLQGIGISP